LKLLALVNQWPEPTSSAAGQHFLQVLDVLSGISTDITIGHTADLGPRAFDFTHNGIRSQKVLINDTQFDRFIGELQPDIVLFDRFMLEEQFGWRVNEQCSNALRILNTEDLHGLRAAREEALKYDKNWLDLVDSNSVMLRELASLYRCDLTLVISDFEYHFLKRIDVPERLLHYVPFLLEVADIPEPSGLPTFSERRDFIFIGNFRHKPNVDAVNYFVSELWPGIKKQLCQANFHIYGAYSNSGQRIGEALDVIWHGAVDHTDEVLSKSKVNIVPLRFGAGLKGKVVEAMMKGTPSVMTQVGAEGVFGTVKPNDMLAFDNEDFIQKAIKLYTDEASWQAAQQVGFEIIKSRFDKTLFENALIDRIQGIKEQLLSHRKSNITGAMLQQNDKSSTKYMSKWIEAKNR